ncbi:TPA: hypothetical protein ACSP3W_003429 [Aeromonas veronii]|uniref:hypothetical protein n=1 Tax=Aeromonas veronii TaxID=654 RepID=UPI0038E3F911
MSDNLHHTLSLLVFMFKDAAPLVIAAGCVSFFIWWRLKESRGYVSAKQTFILALLFLVISVFEVGMSYHDFNQVQSPGINYKTNPLFEDNQN